MTITRRQFTARTFATLVLASSLPALLPLAGCPVTQSQLVALTGEVGTGLAEILPYLKSVSADAATKIEAAFVTLQADVEAWKPGQVISVIEQAVNDFVAAMSAIPVLAEYQPLVALIVATVEGIITLLVPTSAQAASAQAKVSVAQLVAAPKTASSFRSAWNKQVKGNAKLTGMAIS